MRGSPLFRVVLGFLVVAGTLTLGGSAPAHAEHDSCGVLAVAVNPVATRAFGEYMRREHNPIVKEGDWHDHYWRFEARDPRDEWVDCSRSTAEITYNIEVTVKYVKKVRIPFRKSKKTVTVWRNTWKGKVTVEGHWTLIPPTTACVNNVRIKKLHVDNVHAAVERAVKDSVNDRFGGKEYCHSMV